MRRQPNRPQSSTADALQEIIQPQATAFTEQAEVHARIKLALNYPNLAAIMSIGCLLETYSNLS